MSDAAVQQFRAACQALQNGSRDAAKFLWSVMGSPPAVFVALLRCEDEAVRYHAANILLQRFRKGMFDSTAGVVDQEFYVLCGEYVRQDPEQSRASTRLIWCCLLHLAKRLGGCERIQELYGLCVTPNQKAAFAVSAVKLFQGTEMEPVLFELGTGLLSSLDGLDVSTVTDLCVSMCLGDLSEEAEHKLAEIARRLIPMMLQNASANMCNALEVIGSFLKMRSECGVCQQCALEIGFTLSCFMRTNVVPTNPGSVPVFYALWECILGIEDPVPTVLRWFLEHCQEFQESVVFMSTHVQGVSAMSDVLEEIILALFDLTQNIIEGEEMDDLNETKQKYCVLAINLITAIMEHSDFIVERTLVGQQLYNLFGESAEQILDEVRKGAHIAYIKLVTFWGDQVDESRIKDALEMVPELFNRVSWDSVVKIVCSLAKWDEWRIKYCLHILSQIVEVSPESALPGIKFVSKSWRAQIIEQPEIREILRTDLTKILSHKTALSVHGYKTALLSFRWIVPPSKALCDMIFDGWLQSHQLFDQNIADWLWFAYTSSYKLKQVGIECSWAFHQQVCAFLVENCGVLWQNCDIRLVIPLAQIVCVALEHSDCPNPLARYMVQWIGESVRRYPTPIHFECMRLVWMSYPQFWQFSDFLNEFDPGAIESDDRIKIIICITRFVAHLLSTNPAEAWNVIPLPFIARCWARGNQNTRNQLGCILQNHVPKSVFVEELKKLTPDKKES